MRNTQILLICFALFSPIFSLEDVKKIKKQRDPIVSESRLGRGIAVQPVAAIVAVQQPSPVAYYQPKIDASGHHSQPTSQVDYNQYAALLSHAHAAAPAPQTYSHSSFDFAKAYKVIPQYGLGKYSDAFYKSEPVAEHYSGAPESVVTLVQKHEDDKHDDKHSHHPSYQFGYRVKDPHHGSYFGHSEVNDGHIAKGQYHVLLPDGRLQNVKYHADHHGYHAIVSYDGSKHP